MALDTNTIKEDLAVRFSVKATHASLHTASPGTTGANEHVRGAITWTTGSSDGIVTGTCSLSVGAGVTVTHGGTWDAASGGNFLSGGALSASYTGAGTYNLTVTYTQS